MFWSLCIHVYNLCCFFADNKPEVHKVKFKEMKVKVDQNDEDKGKSITD